MTRPALRSLGVQCLAWVAVCLGYHEWLRASLAASGRRLGWVSAAMPAPLHALWQTSWSAWLLPAAGLLALVFLLRDRLFRDEARGAVPFVLSASLLFVAVAGAVALMDGFVTRGDRTIPVFAVQHAKPWLESWGDVDKLEAVGARRFGNVYSDARRLRRLANHSRSHPPGPVYFQWVVRALAGVHLLAPPLAELLFGALVIPLTYLIGRDLYGERVARIGAALTALAPNVVMFATSMDLPFAVFLLLAAWLLMRGVRRGSPGLAVASGLAMALAGFMTFSVVMLVALLAVWLALELAQRRLRPLPAVAAAALGASVCVGAFFGLAHATGYHVLRAVETQTAFDAQLMGSGTETAGVYWQLSLANLMAFAIGVGAPVACLVARGLLRRRAAGAALDSLLVATAVTAAVFAFSSLYSLEVERIWLFLTPLLALGAARVLREDGEREFGAAVAVSCVLLFAMEACLGTAW
jgi:hypothetical protein